jgi:hypothetical protein
MLIDHDKEGGESVCNGTLTRVRVEAVDTAICQGRCEITVRF